MKLVLLSALLVLASAVTAQDDEKCAGKAATAYTPFRSNEHRMTGYVITDVQLAAVVTQPNVHVARSKRGRKHHKKTKKTKKTDEWLATNTPHSDNVALPNALAARLFGDFANNTIRVPCDQTGALKFQLGGEWFGVPLDSLIVREDAVNGACKANIFPYDGEFILMGAPFVDRHCFFDDKPNQLGVAVRV
ncbi:hypothetical protein M3Y99_01149700 [Aphelenchoides fujianensis]|nr:hypothetical protein M3Y99_01149700 [Aphelenchoides fujianensis]